MRLKGLFIIGAVSGLMSITGLVMSLVLELSIGWFQVFFKGVFISIIPVAVSSLSTLWRICWRKND